MYNQQLSNGGLQSYDKQQRGVQAFHGNASRRGRGSYFGGAVMGPSTSFRGVSKCIVPSYEPLEPSRPVVEEQNAVIPRDPIGQHPPPVKFSEVSAGPQFSIQAPRIGSYCGQGRRNQEVQWNDNATKNLATCYRGSSKRVVPQYEPVTFTKLSELSTDPRSSASTNSTGSSQKSSTHIDGNEFVFDEVASPSSQVGQKFKILFDDSSVRFKFCHENNGQSTLLLFAQPGKKISISKM